MTTRALQADWVDYVGLVRSQRIYAGTNPCTVLTQLQALSNAAVLRNFDANLDPGIGSTTHAVYQGVAQVASILFTTAGGNIIELLLPAPQLTAMLADQTTLDPTALAALIAACTGNLSDVSGDLATAFLGGRLLASNPFGLTPIGT